MSETEKPKRKWFQFHLSTAVLLMFVAGGLIWAEIHRPFGVFFADSNYDFGWPIGLSHAVTTGSGAQFDFVIIVFDVACCLAIMSLVAVLYESLIRRREGRKQQTQHAAQVQYEVQKIEKTLSLVRKALEPDEAQKEREMNIQKKLAEIDALTKEAGERRREGRKP